MKEQLAAGPGPGMGVWKGEVSTLNDDSSVDYYIQLDAFI